MTLIKTGRRLDIELRGELDMATRGPLLALAPTMREFDSVSVEMSGVGFIDSSGVGALVSLQRAGVPLTIRGADGAARRTFKTLNLTELLNVVAPSPPED